MSFLGCEWIMRQRDNEAVVTLLSWSAKVFSEISLTGRFFFLK
jgi:hypothetical protein